jgi:hypothetical protein
MYVCTYACMCACCNSKSHSPAAAKHQTPLVYFHCMYVCMHVCVHVAIARVTPQLPPSTKLHLSTFTVCMYVCMYACMCACCNSRSHSPAAAKHQTPLVYFHCMYVCVCMCESIHTHTHIYIDSHLILSASMSLIKLLMLFPVANPRGSERPQPR